MIEFGSYINWFTSELRHFLQHLHQNYDMLGDMLINMIFDEVSFVHSALKSIVKMQDILSAQMWMMLIPQGNISLQWTVHVYKSLPRSLSHHFAGLLQPGTSKVVEEV